MMYSGYLYRKHTPTSEQNAALVVIEKFRLSQLLGTLRMIQARKRDDNARRAEAERRKQMRRKRLPRNFSQVGSESKHRDDEAKMRLSAKRRASIPQTGRDGSMVSTEPIATPSDVPVIDLPAMPGATSTGPLDTAGGIPAVLSDIV